AARQDGYVRFERQPTGGELVAELLEHFDTRADKGDAGLGAGAGEMGVLRQEAVARMDGVDLVLARQGDNGFDIEVGAQRLAGRADPVSLVRLETVQGEAVFVCIDRHSADAELV